MNFQTGTETFYFPNGDKYEGEFCAHRNGIVWREGFGKYTTKDSQIYSGYWYNDKLIEKQYITIEFPNGDQYNGPLMKNKYSGSGMYCFNNNLQVFCNFFENKPIGMFLLNDFNNRLWLGEEISSNMALIQQQHVFFTELNNEIGKGRPKIKKLKRFTRIPRINNEELRESQVFAKSLKTKLGIDFKLSDWYQNYMKFKENYHTIASKVKENGLISLNEMELKWYNDYMEFERNYKSTTVKLKNSNNNLLQTFCSKEYQESCPPINVFYPKISNNSSKSSETI